MQTWFYVEEDDAAIPGSARDFTFETLPVEWNLTSPVALTRGSDGRWIEAASNTARIFYHPITLARLGVLIEPAVTTYVHKSTFPEWIENACVVQAEPLTNPFGNGSVAKVQPSSSPTGHSLALPLDGTQNRGTAPNSGTLCTFILVVKPTGFGRLALTVRTKAGTSVSASYNMTGSVISQTGGVARIYRDTDGFWQLELTTNIGTGTSIPQLELHFEQNDGTRIFTGTSDSYVHIAHCGFQDYGKGTTPIVNTGTVPKTRNGDVLSCTPTWMRIGAYAFGVRWAPLTEQDSSEATVLMLGSGTDYARLYCSQFGTFQTTIDNSAAQASLTAGAPFRLALQTDVFSADTNAFFFAHNGDNLDTDSSGSLPGSFSILRIGANSDGSVAAPIILQRIRYWPQSLTPDQTREFSSDLGTVGEGIDLISIQSDIAVHTVSGDVFIPVTRSAAGQQVSVSWATEDGTALADVDYIPGAGTLTFPEGEPVAFVSIPVIDTGASDIRTFKVTLANPSGTAVGTTLCTVTVIPYSVTAIPTHDATFLSSFPSGWKITRASTGWQRDANGVWTSVGSDQARLLGSAALSAAEFSRAFSTDFLGLLLQSGSTSPGILVERAGRNRLADSVRLSNATMSQGTLSAVTTVTAGSIPIGTRVVSYRENTALGSHFYSQTLTSTTGAVVPNTAADYYYSVMLKTLGGLDTIMLSTSALNLSFPWAKFTFSTMTVHSTSGSNVFNARIERCPGFSGIYRIGFGFNSGSGSTQDLEFIIQTLDNSHQTGFTGRGSGVGFDVYHNQLEDGQDWTSPIETTGTAVQRAADVLEPDGDWHIDNNRTWAMAVKGSYLSTRPDTQSFAQVLSHQGETVTLAITPSQNPQLHMDGVVGGTARTPIPAENFEPGVGTTLLINSRSVVTDLYRDGASRGSMSAAITSSSLRLGATVSGTAMGAIVVERIRFWSTNLSPSNSQLFSGNIGAAPPVGTTPQPIVSLPKTILVSEGTTGEPTGGDTVIGGFSNGFSSGFELLKEDFVGNTENGALTLTKSGDGACSVLLSTVPYTAQANTDFTPVSNQLVSFALQDTEIKINLVIPEDFINEGVEKFTILLTGPTNCLLGNAVCSVSIV